MSDYNTLRLAIYSSGTTEVIDVDGSLGRASVVRYSTYYPGGLYGDAEVWVPRDVRTPWLVREGYRLALYNGLTPVWEGLITGLTTRLTDVEQGVTIRAVGYWGGVLGNRTTGKFYADNRTDQSTWVYQANTTGCGDAQCDLDRNGGRLRFTPKSSASWANGDYAAVRYTAPCLVYAEKISFTYDLKESTQAWGISVWNLTSAASEWFSASDASGTASITFAACAAAVELRYTACANQTGCPGGVMYGEFRNVMIYSTSSPVTACLIAKDIIATESRLNSTTTCINSTCQAIEPFLANGREPMATVLARAAGFGDSSGSSWAAGVRHSEYAPTPTGAPVLYLERQPALTDYDYVVRLDDPNVVPPIEFTRDLSQLANWVAVSYTDETGQTQWLTPFNQSSLTDTTSSGSYGRRDYLMQATVSGSAAALAAGQRYLAAWKDPRYYVSAPISVVGYITAKTGQRVPAAEVCAGKRLKIENYLEDLQGTGLTFLITGTTYDDASETVQIQTGVPDDLSVYLARQAAGMAT